MTLPNNLSSESVPVIFLLFNFPVNQVNLLCVSVDDIVSSRSVGNHGDRVSDLLFHELDVLSAVLWKILIVLNSTDIAFPSRKLLEDRLCLL